jgi:Tol biopolymer transport system component
MPPDADDECARRGGLIAFSSDRDGDDEVFVSFADGGSPRPLTSNAWPDSRPRWARDGVQISFVAWPSGFPELRVTTKDGADALPVSGGDAIDQVWFPTSDRVLFRSNRDGNYEVYSVRPDGTGLANLSMHTAQDAIPGLSPDGARVVFSTARDGNYEIAVMNTDGSQVELLTATQSPVQNLEARWSPAGSAIAFLREGQIWTMTSSGLGETELLHPTTTIVEPFEWSPDGSKIAYVARIGSNYDVWVMSADGSQRTNVSNHEERDDQVRWSPDGASILFTSRRDGNEELYTVRADGSMLKNITSAPSGDQRGDWVGCP